LKNENMFGLFNSELFLPKLNLKNFNQNDDNFYENLYKDCILCIESILISIDCNRDLKDNISFLGYLLYENNIYAFIDISLIDITCLNLNRKAKYWFALVNEICNSKKLCNININTFSIDILLKKKELISLNNPLSNTYFPSPDIGYKLDEYNKCMFVNMFGISKINKEIGYFYYFNISFNNEMEELFLKNDNLVYGINRIALLTDKSYLINEDNLLENIYNENDIINENDEIIIYNKNNDNITLLCKYYNQQIPLSCHKIDKSIIKNIKKSGILEYEIA